MSQPTDVSRAHFHRTPGKHINGVSYLLKEMVIRRYKFRRDSIVLALIPDSPTPFVIWHRVITSDSPTSNGDWAVVESFAWGHYHRTLEEAITAYEEKIEEYSSRLHPEDGEDLDA